MSTYLKIWSVAILCGLMVWGGEVATASSTLTPIYRLYNTKTGVHLYTRGIADRNAVMSKWPEFEFTDGAPAFYMCTSVSCSMTSTPDTTSPVITLTGPAEITIVQGSTYTELGATADDDRDGDLSSQIILDNSSVDTATVGVYTVTYDVADAAGNAAATVTRTITVIDQFDFVEGYDTTAPDPQWSKPALGATYVDAAYGTTVRRMTSAQGTRFNRNNYSRIQPENADGSDFLTYHGDAEYHVYDTSTLVLTRATDIHPDGEPQWHPTDPHKIRHLDGPNSYTGSFKLHEYDTQTASRSAIADLTSSVQAIMPSADYMYDAAEGSPSADGNRYAWMVDNASEDLIGIVTYDVATQQILGSMTALPTDRNNDYLNWVSVSPSGDYVLASWSQGSAAGTYMYDIDFTNEYRLTTSSEHSDIGVGANGNDYYIYVDFATGSPDAGWVVSVDLVTKQKTRLFNLYDDANTSIHFSAKNFDKPGWALVSTYNCHNAGAWSCYKVFAVNVTTGRILNLAHTYNCGDNYWTETQASVNRDFSRVYFNSDAGSCGQDAEVYQISVPPFS